MGRGRGAAALGHMRVAFMVATGASSNPATPKRLPGTQLPVEETEAQIRAGGVGQSQVLSSHPCWASFLGPLPQEGWTQTGGESPSLPMHADGQRPVTRWAAQASPGPHPHLSPAWQAPASREIIGCDVKGCLPGSVNAWWGGCMLFPVGCGLRAWVQVRPHPDSLVSLFYVFVCGCVRPQLRGHAGSRRAGFSLVEACRLSCCDPQTELLRSRWDSAPQAGIGSAGGSSAARPLGVPSPFFLVCHLSLLRAVQTSCGL